MAKVSDVYYSLGCSDNAVQAEKETAKVSKYIHDSGQIYVSLVKYKEYISNSDQTLCQGTGKEGLSYCDKDYCNSSNLASPLVGLLVAALVSVLVH